MTFPNAIQKDRGEPARVRIGEIVNGDIVLQGVVLQDVGIIDPHSLNEGDSVALIGQSAVGTSGSSWLALGRIAPADDPPVNKTIGVVTAIPDAQSTTTGAFVDITSGAAPISLDYTKRRASSDLVVHFYASAFVTVAAATVQFGVNISGADFNTTYFFFNTAAEHHAMSSVHRLSGISAGDLTITARWLRTVNNVSMNGDDRVSFSAQETM